MDTKNWFGEHAASIRLIALAGGIALAAIILLDLLTHKKNTATTTGAAPATALDTSPATSGTSATSTLQNPGETYYSILEDYSSHVGSNSNDVTTNTSTSTTTLPPVAAAPLAAAPIAAAPAPAPVSHPASTGGATVPVPTPHPSTQYTVRSGDSLWSIASRFLGNGADWRELYNWNRSTVGGNPNLIYPGERLTIN